MFFFGLWVFFLLLFFLFFGGQQGKVYGSIVKFAEGWSVNLPKSEDTWEGGPEQFRSKGSHIMFLLDGLTLSPYLVTRAPQGGRILKVSLKMGSLGEFQRCSKLFGVFCPKSQDRVRGSRRAEPLVCRRSPPPSPHPDHCLSSLAVLWRHFSVKFVFPH